MVVGEAEYQRGVATPTDEAQLEKEPKGGAATLSPRVNGRARWGGGRDRGRAQASKHRSDQGRNGADHLEWGGVGGGDTRSTAR